MRIHAVHIYITYWWVFLQRNTRIKADNIILPLLGTFSTKKEHYKSYAGKQKTTFCLSRHSNYKTEKKVELAEIITLLDLRLWGDQTLGFPPNCSQGERYCRLYIGKKRALLWPLCRSREVECRT